MVPRFRRPAPPWLVVAATLCVVACSGTRTPDIAEPVVILISLDGTTLADVRDAPITALADLKERGAVADRLVPVFPTNTFPNHVSLVTGVTPDLHGVVNNVFLDPQRGLFRYANDPVWIEVEPLWSIAARHGVVSAAFHWIGSEGPWRNGHGPRYWRPFDAATPESEKVDQILAWLDIEQSARRPRLITSWFRGADGAAHRFGPGSKQVHAALRSQDRALERLVKGLESRGVLEAGTLLVVSDHGMAAVHRHIDLKAEFREAGLEASVFGGGGIATVAVPGGAARADRVAAVARSHDLIAIRPGSDSEGLPLDNPRFGDLVVLAPLGTAISSRGGPPMRGSHGYLPTEPSMGALLIAAGRGVRPGTVLGTVRTIDVAPTVLALLGIDPPPSMQGRPIAGLVPGRSSVGKESGAVVDSREER